MPQIILQKSFLITINLRSDKPRELFSMDLIIIKRIISIKSSGLWKLGGTDAPKKNKREIFEKNGDF